MNTTTTRTIAGVEWNYNPNHATPTVGEHVYLLYTTHGKVQAKAERPDCNPQNIAEGIVRKRWSPNQNSFYYLEVEVTADFPA